MAETTINEVQQEKYIIQYFRGIDDHARISEGNWQDALNITTDEYPAAQVRKARKKAAFYSGPTQKSPLVQGTPVAATALDGKVYVGTENGVLTGNNKRVYVGEGLKQIVSMGKNLYTNTGYLLDDTLEDVQNTAFEAEWYDAQIMLCNEDSEAVLWRTAKPEKPEAGTLWYDNEGSDELLQFDGSEWTALTYRTIYLEIPDTPDRTPQTGDLCWRLNDKKVLEYDAGRKSWERWKADAVQPATGDYRYDPLNELYYIYNATSQKWTKATVASSQPGSPTDGALWYDSGAEQLKKYRTNYWQAVALLSDGATPADGDYRYNAESETYEVYSAANQEWTEVFVATAQPGSPSVGALWYNSSTETLMKYRGNVWTTVTCRTIWSVLQDGALLWKKQTKKLMVYEADDESWSEDGTQPADGDYMYEPDEMCVYVFVATNKRWVATTATFTNPDEPQNGEYLFDPETNGLYRYNDKTKSWVAQVTYYIRVGVTGNVDVSALKSGDAVRMIAGGEDSTYHIHTVGENFITLEGNLNVTPTDDILAAGEPLTTGVRIIRRMPMLDFICERDNRMWGCRYGENDEGVFVNEIYASALGDPLNWYKDAGSAGDSWTASVGSPGPWTGMAVCGEYLAFFKEDRVYLLSGDLPSSYRLTEFRDHGVQIGSEKSLVSVKGALIYKSNHGIMRLTPYSYPTLISDDLNDDRWTHGSAGTDGRRYYISMYDGEMWALYVYDTLTGYWTKESQPLNKQMLFVNYRDWLATVTDVETTDAVFYTFDAATAKADMPDRDDQQYANVLAYLSAYFKWTAKCMQSQQVAGAIGANFMAASADAAAALEEPNEDVTQDTMEQRLARFFLTQEYLHQIELVYLRNAPGTNEGLTVQDDAGTWLTETHETERDIEWRAETGWLGLGVTDEKRMRTVQIRVHTTEDTRFGVFIAYAGETGWTEIHAVNKGKTGTYRIAYTPARRNDAFRLKIEGSGPMTLYNITYQMESGGDMNVC